MTITKAVRLAATGSCFAITFAANAGAQAAGGLDPAHRGEIVVTAQKRTQNILNVPMSLSVVDAKKLDDLHVTGLADYFAYVPGLQAVSQGTPGQDQLSIRGISPQGAGAATVATYIDDTPVGSSSAYSRSASYSLDLLPYDVQRIEVLRGPQGTLYGSSAESGLLKYVLTSPSLEKFSARVGGDLFGISGAGQAGGGGRAQVSVPIITDKLGVLASYAYESTPGYVDDARTRETDINSMRQQSGRLALLWKPSDDVSVRLGALYQKIDSDGNGTVALSSATLLPVYGDRSDDRYIDQPFNKTIQYYSAALNWDLGFADLTSATSYSYTDLKQRFDNTPSFGTLPHVFDATQPPLAITPLDLQLRLHKVTEEVRLASPTGSRLEWLVGSFYTHEQSTNHQVVPAFNMTTGQPLSAPYNLLADLQLPSTYQEYAFFGNATFHLDDMFALSGGVRYSHNNQTFSQINSGPLVGNSNVPGTSSEGVATYSVSPEIHLNKKVMLYARVATGYRPGGPNFSLPNVPATFKADRLTNYEAGIKSQLWDNRLTFTAAYFYINWKDVQVSVVNPVGISYFANAGRTKSEGVEADASITVAKGMTFAGTFAYTDATLKDNAPSIGGVAGEQLAYVPRYSGSAQADYTTAIGDGWTAHGGAALRLQGCRFSGVGTQAFVIPGYGALDLNADLSRGRYTIKIFAKNMTNRVAYDFYGPRFSGGALTELGSTLIQPRTLGVAVDVKL